MNAMAFTTLLKFGKLFTKKITWIIIGILVILFLFWQNQKLKQRTEVLNSNQEILLEDKEDQIRALRLTSQELESVIEDDDQIKRVLRDSLNIKIKQVEDLKSMPVITRIDTVIQIQDSIVYITGTDSVAIFKYFNWEDTWNKAYGQFNSDFTTIDLSLEVTDTLIVTMYWERKGKFIPKLFGKKVYQTEVINVNPSATVHINKNIEILKRKR